MIRPIDAPIALGFLLIAAAFICGCAETSGGGPSNEDFEIRSMIAADRQQMQAMDERLRRMESQIQDLVHNPSAPVASEGNNPPPGAQTSPSAPAPLGAPPAPVNPAAAPPMNPGAEAVPPGASAAPPEGAEGSPEGGTTVAHAGNAAGAEGAGVAAVTPEASANAEAGADDEGNNAGETGNGGAQAAANSATASANPPAAEEGGEEVASVPPSSGENAPAESVPPARWPQDLTSELQSPASSRGGAGKLFLSGLDAMKNRDYSAAVERFAALQKKYPHSDLTEPAAYFSASALNEMGKYDQAILQYNDLVMRYPKGKYASEALLREAAAFVQINDKVDARLTLQKLLSEHAGTPQAAAAAGMMKGLESD